MAKSIFEGLNREQANALANHLNDGFDKEPVQRAEDDSEQFVQNIKLAPVKGKDRKEVSGNA